MKEFSYYYSYDFEGHYRVSRLFDSLESLYSHLKRMRKVVPSVEVHERVIEYSDKSLGHINI